MAAKSQVGNALHVHYFGVQRFESGCLLNQRKPEERSKSGYSLLRNILDLLYHTIYFVASNTIIFDNFSLDPYRHVLGLIYDILNAIETGARDIL
jgi:hypothetical protein